MGQDWPSPPHHHETPRLPVVEDLPVAWEGYDRASVDTAFDSFYRHIAQLDSTLRALEAVEAFREEAADLRADLRSIRAAGWSPYPRGYALAPERSLFGSLPPAVPRIALEVVFLVAVAAVVAAANFTSREIVGVMAAAVGITFLLELVASRDRRANVTIPELAPGEQATPELVVLSEERATRAPAAVDESTADVRSEAIVEPAEEALGWAAFAEPAAHGAESVMGALASEAEAPVEEDAEDEPAAEGLGEKPEDAPPLEEPTPPEPVLPEPLVAADEPSGHFRLRRRLRRREPQVQLPPDGLPGEPEPGSELEPEPPKHVRVVPQPEPAAADDTIPPWERGFDETGEIR